MEDKIRKVINALKEEVRINLLEINANQDTINEILAIVSREKRAERHDEFNTKFEKNKKLLDVNDDMIRLQLDMVKFIEKYRRSNVFGAKKTKSVKNTDKEYTKDELFDLTVDEVVPFNQDHPCFDDEEFYKDLLSYYTNREKYEACEELVRTRG